MPTTSTYSPGVNSSTVSVWPASYAATASLFCSRISRSTFMGVAAPAFL